MPRVEPLGFKQCGVCWEQASTMCPFCNAVYCTGCTSALTREWCPCNGPFPLEEYRREKEWNDAVYRQ